VVLGVSDSDKLSMIVLNLSRLAYSCDGETEMHRILWRGCWTPFVRLRRLSVEQKALMGIRRAGY
jgi:hypothetical protein